MGSADTPTMGLGIRVRYVTEQGCCLTRTRTKKRSRNQKMLNEENKKLCWEILTKYGIRNQQHMVIEECSELQKAICKLYRAKTQEEYKGFYRNFIEELLDVIAVCQQMLLAENIDMDAVNDFIKAKLIIALERADRNE